jgi:CBS-domain-containing membrane protein
MKLSKLLCLSGFRTHRLSCREGILSGIGGFLGIVSVYVTSLWFLGSDVAILLVPSMGASAVLLFAAPHAAFSQPWNLIAGHSVSAAVGVSCWLLIPNQIFAASVSVGLAITVMYFARCIHPPGGATALAAVIGSEELHALGYAYEFQPVLINAVTLLFLAVLFNSVFQWRRYPANMQSETSEPGPDSPGYDPIQHEDFVYALSQIDTFIDATEEDLLKIYELATRRRLVANTETTDR